MNENEHKRAQEFFARSMVEGLAANQQAWLDMHLRECAGCARQIAATQELVRALRSVPVAVPSDLAARTQMRVRLRAQEFARASSSTLMLWAITAASWLLGVFSAPLVWRGFTWLGGEFRLPKLMLELGFVLWWTVPALIAVAAVLHQRASGYGNRRGSSSSANPITRDSSV